MKPRIQAKQSPNHETTFEYSHRYGCAAILESNLERDYFNWRQFDSEFEYFKMQPDPLIYTVPSGQRRRYTPEAEYIDQNGEHHADEVKYVKEAQKPDLILKHQRIEIAYAEQSVLFHVLTEHDIRVGHRAENLRFIRPAWAMPSPDVELSKLIDKVAFKEAPIGVWAQACLDNGMFPCLVKRAIAHKLFTCDITQPWDELYLSC